MSYRDFNGVQANFNYAVAALLVTYFNHFDGDGDSVNLNKFLQSLKQGVAGEEALNVLLADRSFEQLEEEISEKWGQRGVHISFD